MPTYDLQYFEDAHTTEKKMIQLVDRLNTEYDVQNISSREAAEQALNRLTVSANDRVLLKVTQCSHSDLRLLVAQQGPAYKASGTRDNPAPREQL